MQAVGDSADGGAIHQQPISDPSATHQCPISASPVNRTRQSHLLPDLFADDFDAGHQAESYQGENHCADDLRIDHGLVHCHCCVEGLLSRFCPDSVFDCHFCSVTKTCHCRELCTYDSFGVAPRPDFHKRPDDKACKDDEGFLVPALKQPVQEF